MTDPDPATCPRCGAASLAGGPAGLCPRCMASDAPGGEGQASLVAPSSPARARRKRWLGSAAAAVGVILLAGLWLGKRQSDAMAHYELGVALEGQGKQDEAIPEYRKARDNAPRGSKLAQLIERALTELDH